MSVKVKAVLVMKASLIFPPQVVLSAPADNQSGTGSKTAPPTPLADPCEFDSCPAGSPAIGFNASDRECEKYPLSSQTRLLTTHVAFSSPELCQFVPVR